MSVSSDERQERQAVVHDLQLRATELKLAKGNYEAALWKARHLGLANTVIARAVGLSEAAIRMYFKRNS